VLLEYDRPPAAESPAIRSASDCSPDWITVTPEDAQNRYVYVRDRGEAEEKNAALDQARDRARHQMLANLYGQALRVDEFRKLAGARPFLDEQMERKFTAAGAIRGIQEVRSTGFCPTARGYEVWALMRMDTQLFLSYLRMVEPAARGVDFTSTFGRP
jgi:hypothetical protein